MSELPLRDAGEPNDPLRPNECAKKLGRAPSLGELTKMKRVAKAAVYRKFGKYQNALEMCGLERTGPGYQTDLREVVITLDQAPGATEVGVRQGSVSVSAPTGRPLGEVRDGELMTVRADGCLGGLSPSQS